MLRKIVIVGCGVVIGFFIIQLQRHPQLSANSIADRIAHPTDTRIRYAIGNIDPAFNVSYTDVLLLSEQAAHIWENGLGQPFFVHDPQARLKIHLVYDERQQKSQYVQAMNQRTRQDSDEIDRLEQQLQQMVDDLKQRDQQLRVQYQQLRQEQTAWRRLEHEDGENLHRLKDIEQTLKYQDQQLEQDWQIYRHKTQAFNDRVKVFNQAMTKVDEYNKNNPIKTFSKGNYTGNAINIFEFESKDDLRFVIAHEFGHALGLRHHTYDSRSLMYHQIQDQDIENLQLTRADIELFHMKR